MSNVLATRVLDAAVEAELTSVAGGPFLIGTDQPGIADDGEGPARLIDVASFRIARCAVSVELFDRFASESGYVTDAERLGWSYVFAGHVDPGATVVGRAEGAQWWLGVSGASWQRPGGRLDARARRGNHPAVHVSWNDAQAFCAWGGCRLPTEAEWELAAAGGRSGVPFPWGTELEPQGSHLCNVWQGAFPSFDTGADGYRQTAPVDAFAVNGFGLHNVIGNVWEWCSDVHRTASEPARSCCAPSAGPIARVQKGGSYLCHESYCARYRIQARTGNAADSSTANAGFRIAAEVGTR
jgi:formylglycine-generating enzyme required for sulfatase activity